MWWLLAIFKYSCGIAHVKFREDSGNCQITFKEEILKYTGLSKHQPVLFTERPAVVSNVYNKLRIETKTSLIEVFGLDKKSVNEYIYKRCHNVQELSEIELKRRDSLKYTPDIKVKNVVYSGNPSNRIDLVFMGDGFTSVEKAKFFSDIKKLTCEMFKGTSFKSWLPLFNIWAIFVESLESGIGIGKPKQTAFELYGHKDKFGGVFTNKPAYANKICQLTGIGACDYPALIANDQYSGGSGGEFVISTLSTKYSNNILQHEFGHSFANIGEEYDRAKAYFGVNSIDSVGLKWKHWLTGEAREERSIFRIMLSPRHNLIYKPMTVYFYSDGLYFSCLLKITFMGSAPPRTINIYLDNVSLIWVGRSNDIEFYEWHRKVGFSAGTHNLTITGKSSNISSIPLLVVDIELYEFGSPEEFNKDPTSISYYPTWDYNLRKTYRPTNNQCVMRNKTSSIFCPICKEGIWSQFLKRLSLIDSLIFKSNTLSLKTLLLGHLRLVPVEGEYLKITWFHNNFIQSQFNQQLFIPSPSSGNWSVKVKLSSLEIRHDPENVTVDTKSIFIKPYKSCKKKISFKKKFS